MLVFSIDISYVFLSRMYRYTTETQKGWRSVSGKSTGRLWPGKLQLQCPFPETSILNPTWLASALGSPGTVGNTWRNTNRSRKSYYEYSVLPWIFIGRTDAETEAPIVWPPDAKSWLTGRPWCWERLKAGEEGDNRGWDGWMASLTKWIWVWASSRRWWRTGKPGMLQSMGLQRVRHDWAIEQHHYQQTANIFGGF